MDSDLSRIALLGGLLPGQIVGFGLLLLWGLLRPPGLGENEEPRRRLRWGAPTLFALGLLATSASVGTLDSALWPTNVAGRSLAIGAVALACGLIDALSPSRALAWSARALGGAGAALIIVSAMRPHALSTPDVAIWCAVSAACVVAGAWAMEAAPDPRAWVAPAQGAMITQGLLGLVYWSGLAGSATQMGGLIAMLVAAGLAGAIIGRVRLDRGGWSFLACVIVGMLALARVLGSGAVPPIAFALMLAGVPSAALGRWLAGRVNGRFAPPLIALTITAIPIAGGAWLGWSAYNAPDDQHADGADAWDGSGDDEGVYYTDDE